MIINPTNAWNTFSNRLNAYILPKTVRLGFKTVLTFYFQFYRQNSCSVRIVSRTIIHPGILFFDVDDLQMFVVPNQKSWPMILCVLNNLSIIVEPSNQRSIFNWISRTSDWTFQFHRMAEICAVMRPRLTSESWRAYTQ